MNNMGEKRTASALVVDKATGFLATSGNYPCAFDGQRKEEFLRVFKASGLAFYTTCKNLGISMHTINKHLNSDPEFKSQFDEIKREYADDLEAKSRTIALSRDSATLERIFHLRALFPNKYARDLRPEQQRIEINVAGDFLVSHKKESETLETTIVRAIESGDNAPVDVASTEVAQISSSPTETSALSD